MRILILPRYTPRGASSRYRFWQFVPGLRSRGHEVEIKPLVGDGYLTELYTTGRRGGRVLAAGFAARFLATLRAGRYDAVLCEQEIFPFLPAVAEILVSKLNRRFILDYDDAAYCKYDRWPVLRRKIGRLMSAAETVVVGNNHLAGYARQFTRRVAVIPTVVDLGNYPNRQNEATCEQVRVVWIGTPLTASFLQPLLPQLTELQKKHAHLSFRFIGAGSVPCNGLRAETPQWSLNTEAALLAQCDIGIMPLSDNEFTRGKCGLKLIQYMACGLPVVASPVGANCEIVEENHNGFLAATAREWFEKLDALIRNAALRKRLGEYGRAKVAASYTLEHGLSKWLGILEKPTARTRNPVLTISQTVPPDGNPCSNPTSPSPMPRSVNSGLAEAGTSNSSMIRLLPFS
jgi:glycosyltransferase involved in cell wall biosynthesis